MERRTFLRTAAGAMLGSAIGERFTQDATVDRLRPFEWQGRTRAYAVIPVVGDGDWIWNDPPKDETGYLEPREFDVSVGIQLQGKGGATNVRATTAAPVELPEQKILESRIDAVGCAAQLRSLSTEAGQLCLYAPTLAHGQVVSAIAHFRIQVHKVYQGFERDQFPARQDFPREFRKLYMYDSPGIQTRVDAVKRLSEELTAKVDHPWDRAQAFHQWVWDNIEAKRGFYTSVVEALRERVGDCEERAAVFVALCRASGIPARLVWVPNHNWAEFCLNDDEGRPRWIPSHTSAYSWFGWTGAHELVLQKGDSIQVPEKRQPQRLAADWLQWQGGRPAHRFGGEIKPLPGRRDDAGPGARRKSEKGEWSLVGDHPMNKYARE